MLKPNALLSPMLKRFAIERLKVDDDASDQTFRIAINNALENGSITPEKIKELDDAWNSSVAGTIAKQVATELRQKAIGTSGPDPVEMFTGGNGSGVVRVKAGGELYSVTKSVGKHHKTGLPVLDEQGREVQTSSEYEHAKAGVFLKFLAARAGVSLVLNDNERQLWGEMLDGRENWVGRSGNEWSKQISGTWVKALIGDSLSGGVHANPEFFDQNIVQFPLLHGELFPFVDLREVPRSASVEGASIGNPTLSWGIGDATAIPLFDTDGLVAEINTSIHPVTVSIEVGRDFLADAAVDVGRVLEENIGNAFKKELDDVIATGNGTNQPEGIFTASGLNVVNSENDTTGPPTVTDYEALLLGGVGKQYRTSRRCAWIANDTSYLRARSIAVDSSSDQRRVFGMDHESYILFSRPYRINAGIPNTKIAFGDLGKYRLYRRLGYSLEWHTQGESLARRNAALLVVRGRFGGRVMDGNAFAVMEDAQSS